MLSILNEFSVYNLNLDCKLSDITDVYDFISFMLKCEEYYNFEIYDNEAIFLETQDITFLQIEDFFIFLRDGFATPFISKLIIDNLNELKQNRPDYEKHIINKRDNIINDLLK